MSSDESADFNPVGLEGMEFIEYASVNPDKLESIFQQLGFKKVGQHKKKNVRLFNQGKMNFIVNRERDSFADSFKDIHGPSICATAFRVKDAQQAYNVAVDRGAKPCESSPHHSFPAIFGIGDSVIYFVDGHRKGSVYQDDFDMDGDGKQLGFCCEIIDHMTNNVPGGDMEKWCEFYERIFNFTERRYFDIKGKKTGLISKVMRSPDNRITIPINEPVGQGSQIQEYIDEYKGSGIQHVALLTPNIIETVVQMRESGVGFLETPDTYYEQLPDRMPNITEDVDQLRELKILADGDDQGYLLQIFTKNLIGPIFFEVIQRKNHDGFGEGNFQALFDAIEEDQKRRGYLN